MSRRAPRILVLRAPGTNCERETAFAFATCRRFFLIRSSS